MLRQRLYTSQYSFFDKLKSIDYFLVFLILILAAISFMVMYSIDGGKIAYYTKNHFIRFSVFFGIIFISIFRTHKILVYIFLHFLFNNFSHVGHSLLFWSNCIRISKMDKPLLYKYSTF